MIFIEMFNAFAVIGTILFVSGIVLIVLEMFQPGFGIFGVIGVTLLIVNIFVTAETVAQGIALALFTFAIFTILFIIFLLLVSKGKLPQKMILKETEANYKGTADMQHLVGQTGIVTSTCRPVGKANIDGKIMDVVAHGEFIERDNMIQVLEVEGNRVVVKLFIQN